MTDQAIHPTSDHLDIADAGRRIKAIFIGSVGNLVEWYDFYAYTAFALYFAPAFFPGFSSHHRLFENHPQLTISG